MIAQVELACVPGSAALELLAVGFDLDAVSDHRRKCHVLAKQRQLNAIVELGRRERNKMFFNPTYRPFVAASKEPFGGLAPIALQGIQLHEMCHFYMNMDDGNPATSSTTRCLQLAQSFQLFAMQLALGRPFP